ncbi:hypothetical protein [Pikeienuella sp. HZG-20]|uniref:hypothetical protein n=1 Tax=Paludibacillus litoralis TaxID=3133267 RepID=UPI0030ED9F19
MTRRALSAAAALCALAASAPPLSAEAVRVRATDIAHASQVEIPVAGLGFGVERTGPRQIDIVISGGGGAFDLSEIFPGAGARRIVSARLVPDDAATRLRFVLNCDCDYAAHVAGGALTVEFRDPAPGPVLAASEQPAAAPLPQRAPEEGTERAPHSAPAPTPRHAGAPRSGGAETADAAPPEHDVVIARQRLLEQLSRAADQGLLSYRSPEAAAAAPPPTDPERRGRRAPETPEPPPAPAPAPAATAELMAKTPPPEKDYAEAPKPLELPVRARTAVDRAFRADRAETFVDEVDCIADARLDTSDWPDADAFSAELARLSGALLDEFDMPLPDIATGLVKLYIAAGFSAEALGVIDLYPDAVEDSALLRDLAHIVGGTPPAPDGPLAVTGACSGPTAVWRRAAGLPAAVQPYAADDAQAWLDAKMVTAFATLPVSLRVLIGPMIMASFLDDGEVENARKIDLILRRIPGDHGPAFDLARARLLTASHEDEEADALYTRLGRRDLAESREALLRLLESRIRRGAPISADLTEALAEAAFIARGSQMERPLKIAEIRARARAEGLTAALRTVRDAMTRSPAAKIILRDAGHAVLEEASAEETGPLAYVRAVLGYRDEISTEMAGDAARRRIAEELTGLGLANAALAFLDPALGRGAPGLRRAAARAHLAEADAASALETLAGLDGIEAKRLRAKAEEMMGEPASALATLAEIDIPAESSADRADLAFRAGAWAEAAESGPPERRLLAAFMAGSEAAPKIDAALSENAAAAAFLTPPQVEGEVTLGAAQSVIDASRAVRAVIEEALEDG